MLRGIFNKSGTSGAQQTPKAPNAGQEQISSAVDTHLPQKKKKKKKKLKETVAQATQPLGLKVRPLTHSKQQILRCIDYDRELSSL